MADNQQIQDPSTIGTGGLRGLKSIEALKQEGLLKDTPEINSLEDYRRIAHKSLLRAVPLKVGFAGVGESVYDEGITSMTLLDNLQNTRGELQPWYAQIGSGLAKGAVLAGTTFADGIIGTIVGLGNAAATGTFSGFWDNPFSNAMQQINEWSENALPNYYTDAERDEPWYQNIFTANFIGDKFLKNLGFAVGAAYSGKVGAGVTSKLLGLNKARQAFKGAVTASGEALNPQQALQAYREGDLFLDGVKLTEELARDAKKLKFAEPTLKLTGAVSGALGEARIEAINNSKDWFELHKQQLDDAQARVAEQEREALLKEFPQYRAFHISEDGKTFEETLTPEGQAMLQARVDAKFDYQGGLQKLSEDRAKMGNIDFVLNIPLLTVSDAWQFGKFYAGGYNTAKKASNIIKNVAEDGTISYLAQKPSVLRNAMKIAGKGIAEGPYEEMGQGVAGKLAGYKYASELNDFYGAKIDPDAEEETIDWLQATGKAILETYGTVEGWEEGFIGGLTGLVGIPGFRSIRNREGGIQSPVYLQGGVKEDIQEMREQRELADAIITQLNNRVQSPEFLNYYQSAIRHNKYQRDMDKAADNNDNFEFKNAEHNQLINDVIMFEKAGRINDLYEIIDEAGNIQEQDVEQIRLITTNQETGKSVYDGMTDLEVIDLIKKQTEETKEAVDNYRKISQDLQVKIGDYFDEDGLEEMTYYFSNIDNLEKRFKSIQDDLRERLQGVLDASMDADFKSDSEENRVFKLSDLINMSPVRLINNMADSQEAQSFIRNIDRIILVNPNKLDIIDQVNDLQRIALKRIDFIDKYDTYLRNPQLLQQKQEKQRENILKENERKEEAKTRDAILSATNLNEFREALNNESSTERRLKILDDLENEGNQMAKDYKEVQMYNNEVTRAIQNMDAPVAAKDGALALLNNQLVNSNKLEDIANPNSDSINNPETLFDANLSDEANMLSFAEAQYVLLEAMNKVNNDQRFKARFPSEYLTPVELIKGAKTTSKDATGDSGTSTVPPINEGTVDTYEPPVGNITPLMVNEENQSANEAVKTPQSLEKGEGRRQYYRPTIPELHIEASKERDFRPFNVVVAEREKGVNFDAIYNYLRDNGAFSYVNEGNLKAGDELGFMIDPEFNDHTIFIVDRRNNQIVGSLDESDYVVDRYEGLKGLIDRIKTEFNQTGKDKKFIATPTTRVSQMMVGRIPFDNNENNLQNVPGVTKDSIFGIVKNGTLSTNGRVSDDLVSKPMDMGLKEGRMYLLIPNAAGKYSPAAVRVKHFNPTEFNIDDVTINTTPVFRNIQKGVDDIANSIGEEDLSNAVKELKRSLYLGDVHIDWVSGKSGNSIRFTKIQRDAEGREIYDEIEGRRVRREDSKTVFMTEKWDDNVEYEIGSSGVVTLPQGRSIDQIRNEILNILQSFNLPIQVNLGMLNKGGYNEMLLSSGVLTSNITDATVKSSWFTTDYFDVKGNLQQALSPASVVPNQGRKVNTPVGGLESAIAGTPVTIDDKSYYVDLTSNTVRDNNNQVLKSYPENTMDLAYLLANFGSSLNSAIMIDGIALLPNGKVINRNTGAYLTGASADSFKLKLTKKKATIADSKKVIDAIAENQLKVDKNRTNGEYYYILEDDGQYHEYERVHTRLGSNWVESPKQAQALKDLRVNLSKNVDKVALYNNYLKNLSKYYNVDLASFEGKTDVKSRDTIVNIIRDKMSGTNSQIALNAGTSVDSVIRNFFISNDMPVKPSNMSELAFNDLITSLTEIKSNIEARGETFLTNNVVLFQKYNDGSRVAGEVDILSVDANGNFKIYDVKTSKYSFYDFIDRYGRKVNYFQNKSNTQLMSTQDYYTRQLSAYKNLFESQYHTPITTLAILPFVLEYNKDVVNRVTKEKGIIVKYDSAVNVPLAGYVAPQELSNTNSSLAIFNSTLETKNPINNVLPEYALQDSKVGYFLRDGKLHTSYLSPIGKINGVEVYMTKVPNITKGFGNAPAHVATNDYYAVFPNGNSVNVAKRVELNHSEKEVKEIIRKALEGNPLRVLDVSQEKTSISEQTPETVNIQQPITPANINSAELSGAAATIAIELAIIPQDEEFMPEFELRLIDDLSRPVWDKEKELAWLNKVLPQLSESERVVVTQGLIRVAKTGALAWGQFNNGIITLSDIAAEGTAYHEAFHAVFNLLLDNNERQTLLAEAKEMYGDKSDLDLEEDMAEGFREYVMSRENRGIGRKILDFFRELFAKITNWKYLKPSLINYYRMINEGKYAEVYTPYSNISRNREEEYTQEMKDILEKAPRNSQGRLLAPNGKPSNLTERQYAQVRTKAFKDWFGDWENNPAEASKVVDENGEPLVVYHGNKDSNITEFVPGKGKYSNESLYYFSDSKDTALSYATEGASTADPNDYTIVGFNIDPNTEEAKYADFKSIEDFELATRSKGRIYEVFLNMRNPINNVSPAYIHDNTLLKGRNNDGMISIPFSDRVNGVEDRMSKDIQYVVLSSAQIKSATDNIGTFDSNNNDIRYRKVDNTIIPLSELKSTRKINSSTFESLDAEIQEALLKKGWTQEQFDSISQEERDQAVKCIAI